MHAIDLSEWRRVLVTGPDAMGWLDDLVSAGVAPMHEDDSVRSLLLTPTGRIRADFHIEIELATRGYLLIQDPIQPKPIDDLLAPYVLSSDVALEPFGEPTSRLGVWDGDGVRRQGLWEEGERPEPLALDAFDVWRIHQGLPRFGVDLDEDSLPQEAGST